MKTSLRIAIVRSSTTGLSSLSAASGASIQRTLQTYFTDVTVTIINSAADLAALVARRPDIVFLGVKYLPSSARPGREANSKLWVADYLAAHGITTTGSGSAAVALEFDKPAAKRTVRQANLRTSGYFLAEPGQYGAHRPLPINFPLFIKPRSAGGGNGIDEDSVVRNMYEFTKKVRAIHDKYHSAALVEQYLPGREFSVGLLRSAMTGMLAAMPVELIADKNIRGDRILSHAVKSANAERAIALNDPMLHRTISNFAKDIFRALGARDYGRIDIRLDGQDRPYFLEANLIPSLISGYGSFPKACALNVDVDYEAMILNIIELAIARRLAGQRRPTRAELAF